MLKLTAIILLISGIVNAQEFKLSLEESIETGLKNSKELSLIESKSRYTEAKITEINSQMLPQLKFFASYTRLSEVQPFQVITPFSPIPIKIQDAILDNYNLKLSLYQPLFTGFRLSSLKSASQSNLKAIEFEYDAKVNEYAYKIHEAFWSYYNAGQMVDLIRDHLKAVKQHLTDTENFMENGLATMNDVLKLEVQYSNMALRLIEAENNFDIARINFNRIIGYDLNSNTILDLNMITSTTQEFDVEELIEEAQLNRDEIKSAEQKMIAADNGIAAANSGWFPSVYLFGNAYYSRPNQRILPAKDEFKESWDAGITLSWDIWNWGYTSSQTKQANETKLQTELTLLQLKDAIELEVRTEYLNFIKSQKSVEVAQNKVEQAEENYRLTLDKYNYQLATSTDLIDAQTYEQEASRQLITSLINYELSKLRLNKSVGRKLY